MQGVPLLLPIVPHFHPSRRPDPHCPDSPGQAPTSSQVSRYRATVLIRWPRSVSNGSRQHAPGPRRPQISVLIAGGTAAGLMGLLGCTAIVEGSPAVRAGDAPAYRTSVSESVSQSAASSSAKESERQQSVTTEAIYTVCEVMSTSSADAVDAVNSYVAALNANSDPTATEGPAAEALNRSADEVTAGVNDTLPQDMQDAFNSWIDAARATATAVIGRSSPSEFNDAVTRLNDSRAIALNLCDAKY